MAPLVTIIIRQKPSSLILIVYFDQLDIRKQVGVNKVLASHDLLGDLSFSVQWTGWSTGTVGACDTTCNLISGQIMTTQPVVFIKFDLVI